MDKKGVCGPVGWWGGLGAWVQLYHGQQSGVCQLAVLPAEASGGVHAHQIDLPEAGLSPGAQPQLSTVCTKSMGIAH